MIEAIQAETESAVVAMEGGTRQVKEGVTATNQAGESLKEIIRKSEEVGDMITTIASASTQQSSATEEVKNSVEQISKLVEASTIGTQQSARACQDLSELTHGLRNLVEQFQLGRDRSATAYSQRPDSSSNTGRSTGHPVPKDRWVQ